MGSKFKSIVAFRDAKKELVSGYNEKFDFVELGKLALDYSDGIIEARPTVNKELLDYAAEKKLPILKYPGEDFIESYVDFYDKIYPTSED